jgi:hypothetical protein
MPPDFSVCLLYSEDEPHGAQHSRLQLPPARPIGSGFAGVHRARVGEQHAGGVGGCIELRRGGLSSGCVLVNRELVQVVAGMPQGAQCQWTEVKPPKSRRSVRLSGGGRGNFGVGELSCY